MKLHPFSLTLLAAAGLIASPARAVVHTYLVTNSNSSGPGSLTARVTEAVQASRTGPAADQYVVAFDLSNGTGTVTTIIPTGMPVIDADIIVDGTTEDGYNGLPLVEVKPGVNSTGFYVKTANGFLTVRGLAINYYNYGIYVEDGGRLTVTGCHIGLNAAGTASANYPNSQPTGIRGATKGAVRIGGTGAFEGNIIGGNGDGIGLWPEDGAYDVIIVNNRIGTSRSGQYAVPNEYGIVLLGGGVYTGNFTVSGNIISGNERSGIWAQSAGPLTIKSNIIGLAADGNTLLGNTGNGIECESSGADIGGPSPAEGNVVSGSGWDGITITGDRVPGVPDTIVRNNLIGTNAAGTLARPNGYSGVWVSGGNPVLGAAGAGNVISGNTMHGVNVESGGAVLLGNLIGVTRSAAPLGNTLSGIRGNIAVLSVGLAGNLGNANLIGANGSDGITISGGSSLAVQGNFIGVTPTGADIGNGGDGIQHGPWFGSGVMGISSIGGTGAGMGNNIAFNNGDGIYLNEVLQIGSGFLSILGNSIYGNTGLGIDLGSNGVTANDAGDADLGANRRQNFPVITMATPTKVIGTLNSTPATRYRIECFRAEADGTGYGEGRYYLGAVETTTNSSGNANFGLSGLSLTAGQIVTATASVIGAHPDPANSALVIQDTSEFAQNVIVGASDTVNTFVALSAASASVWEYAGSIQFTVQRSGSTTGGSYVPYATSPGSATPGSDYTSVAGTLYFAPGQTQQTITVPIFNDTTNEVPQTFVLQLTSATGAVLLSPSAALITIMSDDVFPVVFVPATFSVPEGHTTDNPINVPIYLSAPSEQTVRCTFTVKSYIFLDPETAILDNDFTATATEVEVEFAPGQTVVTTSGLKTIGDLIVEPDDTLRITLSNLQNAMAGNSSCLVSILNDDDSSPGVVQFSAASYSVAENTGTATITVTRTGGTGGPATVNYGLTGGTATSGTDYLPANTSGTLNFVHGQSSASFTISLVNDYADEGPETMVFTFLGVTGAAVGVPVATTLTITDSDAPGMLLFNAASVFAAENSGSVTLTVIRSSGSDGPASVSFARTGGTATPGTDFVDATTTGTLNFAHGQTTASFTISLVDDYLAETAETIVLQLSSVTGAIFGGLTTTTLTITDTDAPGSLRFSAASYSAAENAGSFTVTVTRTGGSDGPASISYARSGGTAAAGTDFLAATTSGTLNFAHGQVSASFTITLLDDFVIEGPETLILLLSGATGATLGSPATATLTLADNETGYSISGRVTKADGNGLAGVTVILTGSQNASFTTDATGNYTFVGVVGGLNYAVVATASGWTFAPETRTLQNLSGAMTAQDFLASPEVLPELSMSILPNGDIHLFWPIESGTGWTLMGSTTMAAGSWSPVNAPVTQRGGYFQVTIPGTNRAFFRLDRPSGGGGEEM